MPQIQLGIELATQPFHIEQGLLQQHQLRLHLHVEATGGVEQIEQHVAEGDLGERFLEDGLQHGADGELELVHLGIGRYPA